MSRVLQNVNTICNTILESPDGHIDISLDLILKIRSIIMIERNNPIPNVKTHYDALLSELEKYDEYYGNVRTNDSKKCVNRMKYRIKAIQQERNNQALVAQQNVDRQLAIVRPQPTQPLIVSPTLIERPVLIERIHIARPRVHSARPEFGAYYVARQAEIRQQNAVGLNIMQRFEQIKLNKKAESFKIDDCPCCYEEITNNNLAVLVCEHLLCISCVAQIKGRNNVCPMCRETLKVILYK